MSKLIQENVGNSFEVEQGPLLIEYVITDESFDHEFGTQKQYSYEIMSVKYYIEEIAEHVELADTDVINRIADKIVQGDL